MKNKIKLTLFQWIKLLMLSPFWLTSDNGKDWEDFKSSMRPHKCDFDYDNKTYYKGIVSELNTHHECKYKGCNIVSVTDKNGKFYGIDLWMDK